MLRVVQPSALFSAAFALSLLGCKPAERAAPQARAESPPKAAPTPARAPAEQASGPRFVERPDGVDLQAAVAAARQRSTSEGRQFLVYVGAKWCEPCRYFHDAVLAGTLNERFPKLDLMEFDLDADKAELFAAGYKSSLIPLFSKAREDGSAADERHAGGIKGPRSVDFLSKKLVPLLAE
jgi:thiol-disulfide isomerase/thioredoxin